MQYIEFKERFGIQLNEQQEAAVQCTEGAVLLLAVPGSGKTTVLVNRLGYMIFGRNIQPESILTVTYTVAATRDMRRRFEMKFGSEYGNRLEFRTINGISQKILQYFGRITGKEPFQVADKETVNIIRNVFRRLTNQFATENDLKNIQTTITYVKNMRLNSEEIANLECDVEKFPQIYTEYNRELRNMRMIDYDDQMVFALRLLEQFPQVLKYFQRKYPYICVDEAQDTSKIQHDMICLLAGKQGNLFMVGDEDQSIYGFRAAYPEALVSFEQQHNGAKVLLMELNYRSRQEIVSVADQLIQNNKKRHEKHIKAARDTGGTVKAINVKNRKRQYRYLEKVAENCEMETAVLYRNHESALPLIDLLERKGISYRIKNSEMTFFSHPIVRDIEAFIRLALNPMDEEAFLHIYYKMGAGISKVNAMEVVHQKKRGMSLLEAIAERKDISAFTKRQCKVLANQFEKLADENAGKAIHRILYQMGYLSYLEDRSMDIGKAEILRILAEQEEHLADFPKRLEVLRQIVANGAGNPESSFVLSTIHSSKGLEYERVYLLDMMAGILPAENAPYGRGAEPEEIEAYEEERRLYYVGMTRAKEQLYIFTFADKDTSAFSKEILGTERKGSMQIPQKTNGKQIFAAPVYAGYTKKTNIGSAGVKEKIADYENGVIVQHKKYGRGVVIEREGDMAEILFEENEQTKKILLGYAISANILHVEE